LWLETLEDRTVPSTFVVTNNADAGAGSLRQAILNANAHPGPDSIVFHLPSGQNTINLQSALPAITGAVTIDGTTQPGYQGKPVVELNGSNAGAANGLNITASNVTVKGLLIDDFQGDGVFIKGPSTGDRLQGDQIFNNGVDGVLIINSSGNVLGGTQAGEGNFIAGNGGDGVAISGRGATGNRLLGNWIGTLSDGSMAGNFGNGVTIFGGASGNTLSNNTIVGNGSAGVWIHDAGTNSNTVSGNYIGTDAASVAGFGNGLNGITISNGAANNTVRSNVISANTGDGVSLTGAGTTGNTVASNFIGTDRSGAAVLGNTGNGVEVASGANGNLIGGLAARAGNVIANNGAYGVSVNGASQVVILSNSIFANAAGGINFSGGANNGQAAPTLTSLVVSGTHATVQGSVGTPNTWFLLQVFKDGPNGQVLVATRWVQSDSSGNFTVNLRNVSSSDVLTATMTTAAGNSSTTANEITVNGPVVPPPPPPPPPGGIIAA
jgi:parallel beta-helix repeat protein